MTADLTTQELTPHEQARSTRQRRLGRRAPRRRQHCASRGGRRHHCVRWRPYRRGDQARLEEGLAGPRAPRLRDQGAVRETALRARRQQRRHRGPLRRQQQLVRGVRVLVLQALRPRERAAAGRRPQEVGAGRPRADHRDGDPAGDQLHRDRAEPGHPRLPRRGRARRSAARAWSTSAARTSTPAGCWPRPTCRRSRRSAADTSRPRSTCRGARRPTTTAPSSPTTTSRSCTARPVWTSDKDIIAYCRIGERSAHTWFVLHEILEQPNVKNYDGSWTEYGSLVGVPVAVGDEPGQA